jgi:hypothetical protein
MKTTKNYYGYLFNHPIHFYFEKNSPKKIKTDFNKDWLFINPLYELRDENNDKHTPQISVLRFKNHYLVSTPCFLFQTPSEKPTEEEEKNFELFFNKTRELSKQARMPSFDDAVAAFKFATKKSLNKEMIGTLDLKPASINKYFWDTAITAQIIRKAGKKINENENLYVSFLLDSLKALQLKNFKMALLYSGFAIENIAGIKLVNKKINDPVYEYLAKDDKLKTLLHETALYVLGKSMLLENKTLYDQCIKIYRTRSKIAHGEPIKPNDGCLPINHQGATQAIFWVIDTFRWFGLKEPFPIPSSKFVDFTEFSKKYKPE